MVGVCAMQQQQQRSVTNVVRTVPLAVDGELAVSTSAGGTHSMADEKSLFSDFPIQFDVIIISDSNSAVIDQILATAGLQSVFNAVYTNPASFDSSGCLQLSPYHRQDWCRLSQPNLCKGHILDEHCRTSGIKYDVIAFVGDGENDFCPTLRLRETDVVFPRRNYRLEKRIARDREKVAAVVRPWDTGVDIMNALKDALRNTSA